jgi:hypothetical protein
MALVKCRNGHLISDTATVCPQCGDRYPHGAGTAAAQAAAPIIGVILGFVILFAFLSQNC